MPRLDSYVWRARVAPAVIAAAPLLVFIAFVAASPIVGILTPAVGAGAALLAAAELTRSRGLAAEARLATRWDGMPTTRALRSAGDDVTGRARRRRAVEKLARTPLPSAAEEATDPAGTDRQIVHAVHLALARIRSGALDSTLLASENASYGFRRNSRGIKSIALAVLALGLGGAAATAYLTNQWTLGACAIGLDVLLCVYWIAVVRDVWVRQQADRFSDRFFVVAELAEGRDDD